MESKAPPNDTGAIDAERAANRPDRDREPDNWLKPFPRLDRLEPPAQVASDRQGLVQSGGPSFKQATPREQLHERVENDFRYHAPRGEMLQAFEAIRYQAKYLAHTMVEHCPPGRELSTALTQLEQVVMNANAAIARQA